MEYFPHREDIHIRETKNGEYEITHGHHRMAALKKICGQAVEQSRRGVIINGCFRREAFNQIATSGSRNQEGE